MTEKKYKTGLIMEGGAMRGMFTCGVLDVFMENGITFDGAAGISAGAVFGCNFKSRQIGRGIRYNQKYAGDKRYCSVQSLIRTGDLYGVDFCYTQIPEKLDIFDRKAFAENPMEFYVGVTELRTGRPLFHRCTDGGKTDMEWMRGSASMPLVSRVVKIGRTEVLDGGISDAVPYRFMESKGYNRNVIILTQPAGYRKQKTKAMGLFRAALRKYPNTVYAMAHRHEMYNAQMKEIEQLETTGTTLVIRPPKALGISRTESDPRELGRVYRIGRREAQRRLKEIRDFLK